ncbi:MAG: Lipolytic enzyme, G-D-S-L family [Candidatus Uhrbacteria bacterium GW2011_GWF2_39_13]|uniref:Lipolytic enzyme, G-D-S-L family n=1 Tax=Candidatus Uhrbacteria bacterium GW2011_GWF2_39_13 TaxID=1618995 RepID=A0A0G0MVD2_9BACT|nr:MAG: Lipolytic enzyme, G-D-S-L family [Candidatus Uhrbacteria bacterium GW2011_GWF2_39_13]
MKQRLSELKIFKKIAKKEAIKVVALGSSSTQRFMCGMHWFDYVELGFKNTDYRVGQFINSGVSNDSTVQWLERFDNECAVYKPDLVLFTVGANDCRLEHSLEKFKKNLMELYDRIKGTGADLVFQTFYPLDMERAKGAWLKIEEYIPVVRQVAEETGSLLIDTEKRWKKLRDYNIELYRALLRDFAHLNEMGNMVLGLDIMRFFNTGLLVKDGQIDYCRDGLLLQHKIDSLDR